MTDSLRTARLCLRPLSVLDAAAVLLGTPRAPARWAPGYPTDGDLEAARMVLAAGPAAEPLFGPLSVLVDGTTVGGAGFLGPPDDAGTLRCGYGLAPSSRGQGFAAEAVTALLDHAGRDPRARRVAAEALVGNAASHRVLLRCGFRPDPDADPPPGHRGFVLDLPLPRPSPPGGRVHA